MLACKAGASLVVSRGGSEVVSHCTVRYSMYLVNSHSLDLALFEGIYCDHFRLLGLSYIRFERFFFLLSWHMSAGLFS